MNRLLLPLLLLICSSSFIIAQNVESCISVLSSGGANTEINGLSYTYTIGELAIATLKDPPRMISQGFNQPDCGFVISDQIVQDLQQSGIRLYPNPTADILHLEFLQDAPSFHLDFFIINEQGQFVKAGKLPEGIFTHEIDCVVLPSGTYTLNLGQPNTERPINVPFVKI